MKVEIKTVERPHQKVIRQAHYEDRDTGDVREQKIMKADGTIETKLIPITQRVFFNAVYEDVILKEQVHAVKTIARVPNGAMIKSKGGVLVNEIEEEHHFANAEDAERFIELTNKHAPKSNIILGNAAK